MEPSAEDIERVAKTIEKAGVDWLLDQHRTGKLLGWADVPDTVFARAAIIAMQGV